MRITGVVSSQTDSYNSTIVLTCASFLSIATTIQSLLSLSSCNAALDGGRTSYCPTLLGIDQTVVKCQVTHINASCLYSM